jgi:hypothetical protein
MKAEKPWLRSRPPEASEGVITLESRPWKKARVGPFAAHAAQLLFNGYSPVPILPNTKRPPDENWDVLRENPYTKDAIAREAAARPSLGLGVAGEYAGLVPIDIDTDDPEIVAAVMAVLPAPLVMKKGRKGFTAFYRAPDGWIAVGRKFKPRGGAPLVEVLGTGQSVLPPTLHPDTGRPYEWLTLATLFSTLLDELPQLPAAFMADLERALAPWVAVREERPERPITAAPQNAEPGSIRPYAYEVLQRRASELAGMGKESGRNNALLAAVSRVGSWVHNGILSESEVRSALYGAYEACGGIKDHGRKQFEATVRNGLKASRGDELRLPADEGLDAAPGVTIDVSAMVAKAAAKKQAENVIPMPGVARIENHKNVLRLVPFYEITLSTQPRYLVKGVLPSRGLGLVWGPPKQGKSFWTCDIAMHVAMGWEYRGRRTKKGIVIYCVLEGQSGFEARKAAMEQSLERA